MLIQCQSGSIYENPEWDSEIEFQGLKYRIFICVRDEELVVQLQARKKMPAKTLIANFLKDWPVKIGKGHFTPDNLYFLNEEGLPVRNQGYLYVLTLTGMPPVPLRYRQVYSAPSHNNLENCWSVEFPIQSVWEYYQKDIGRYDIGLAKYLLGGLFGENYITRTRLKLNKQFNCYKLTLEKAEAKFGKRVLIVK